MEQLCSLPGVWEQSEHPACSAGRRQQLCHPQPGHRSSPRLCRSCRRELIPHHPDGHNSPHLPPRQCRWAGRARPAPRHRTSPAKGREGKVRGGAPGCARVGRGHEVPAAGDFQLSTRIRSVGAARAVPWCGGSLEPPCTAREGLQLCLTHIPLVGCCSNPRGSSRPSQADEVAASHVAGKQGCTHLEKERNQIWPWHRASFSAWREHREAVPPLLTAEDTKSLSASATFFFSLQVKWLWHLSPAFFTIHCQFVGMFGIILLPKHLISCG